MLSQKATRKKLPPKAQAVQWVAEDIMTDDEIADKLGIHRKTLWRWKQKEKFQAAVQKIRDCFMELASKNGLARKEVRVNELRKMHLKCQQVIEERAQSDEMQHVPGGATGLMVKNYKQIGKDAKEIFEVDTGLIKEMRAIHEQMAVELGQRVTKTEVAYSDFSELADDELLRYAETGELPERLKKAPAGIM